MISMDYLLDENNNEEGDNKLLTNGINVKELDSSLTIENNFDPINQEDLNNLVEMGYDQKMIKKIYILLKPKDINEAIDFLSQEKGIYHHDFMERHGKNDVCFICGESAKNHINYIPERKSLLENIRDSLSKSKNKINANLIDYSIGKIDNDSNNEEKKNGNNNNGKKENEILCDLCLEEMTEDEKEKNTLICKHLFCSDCYLNYFQDKINNNKVGKITCMQHKCIYEFDEDFIISHLKGDQNLINKYKKFKLRSNLYDDPNVKFCPINNCESYARKEGDNKYVTCLEGHKFCFVCSKPWHGKKKCQDEIDKDFKKWKKNKIIKKCPKCKMWTEKNMGCNHMTCAECKYQWCWLCGGKYSERHFEAGGGCAGLQFSDSSLFNYCFCLYLYKFWTFLLQMIIFIFIIHIYGFVKTLKNTDYELSNGCAFFVAFPIWFLWSIAYFCFFICLGIILCIISIFFFCIKEPIIQGLFEDY